MFVHECVLGGICLLHNYNPSLVCVSTTSCWSTWYSSVHVRAARAATSMQHITSPPVGHCRKPLSKGCGSSIEGGSIVHGMMEKISRVKHFFFRNSVFIEVNLLLIEHTATTTPLLLLGLLNDSFYFLCGPRLSGSPVPLDDVGGLFGS